ncbi:MAG: hypothetical protein JW726_04620 [Anaerolineales bacterium]|nr:hypothetical protein [Anaerolineales bacterium]
MAKSQVETWGRQLGSLLGLTLAGPGGAILGNLAGGLVQSIFPGAADIVKGVFTNLTTEAVQKTGEKLVKKLDPEEKLKINHDLQRAFREAFRQAVYDMGGQACFPKIWAEARRDVPEGVVYALTPEGNQLWQAKSPLAEQICGCLQEMLEWLDKEKILPLEPAKEQPAADVRSYLDIEKPWEMNQTFLSQVLGDFFERHQLLMGECTDFKCHLERYLLDRTLVHLGEILKADTPAWRAFNRMLLEGLRDGVKQLGSGQADVLERLDLLLDQDNPAALGQWSEGIATLISSVGKLEKHMDERFDDVLAQAVAQHGEVLVRIDRLMVVSGRIETKVDRVLRFLEDGRYVIEGAPLVYTQQHPEPGESPFKGLLYYDEEDAELFFGREELTAQLVNRLQQQRTLVVVGASGSGKSSLVRAGVIAALRRGEALADGSLPPAGSENWQMEVITPTAHPLEALVTCLSGEKSTAANIEVLLNDLRSSTHGLDWYVRKQFASQRSTKKNPSRKSAEFLLVVDQFEEVFTACKDTEERKAFIDNLVTASAGEGPLRLILVLRADFYAQCGQYEQLRSLLENEQAYIGPMSRAELKEAIEEPARRGKWQFEAGLVDLILHDVGADPGREPEPGALPLLSHTLLEAWKQRRGRMITLESYGEAGGVRQAIAKTAENVYHHLLNEEQRTMARGIFLRLTELGEGTQDTRRQASLSELVLQPESEAQVRVVLKILADARLVTITQDTVEVAHEALIREWPTLRGWLEEDRQGMRIHRNLTEAALEWARLERDESLLYRGARLAEALEWSAAHTGQANPLEMEFVETSRMSEQRQAEEREAQRQRELQQARKLLNTQRQRGLFLGLGLLVALILTGVAFAFSRQASNNLEEARVAGTLSAENASTAVAEKERAETAQAETEAQRQLALAWLWTAQGQLIFDQSARGPYLSAIYEIEAMHSTPSLEAFVTLQRVANILPSPVSLIEHEAAVRVVAFSPDGRRVVSGSADGEMRVWDAANGVEVACMSHSHNVDAVAFSPDGRWVVSASSWDGTVRVWETTSGTELVRMSHDYDVRAVAFSPDGRWVVSGSGDGTARVWDVASGEEVSRMQHDDAVYSVEFSPDGHQVVSGSWDGTARVWEAASGEEVSRMQHDFWVLDVSFSSDGRWVVSGSADNTARVWDASSGEEVAHFVHGWFVWAVAFSPNGQWVVSGSGDYTAQVWDATTGEEVARMTHDDEVGAVAFSPDGRLVVSGSWDGTARVWDATSGKEDARMIHDGVVNAVAFSPDGRWAVSGSADSTGRVWETAAKVGVSRIQHDSYVSDIEFSPDGRWVVSGSWDGTARVWDASSGKEVARMTHDDGVGAVAFSPDGRWVVSGSYDNTMRVWEANTGLEVVRMNHKSYVFAVAFSPDGRWVVSGSGDGMAQVWEVASGQQVSRMQHEGVVGRVTFSPDGLWVISVAEDGEHKLWEARTGLETSCGQGDEFVLDRDFSPDGSWVASGSREGLAWVCEVTTGKEVSRTQYDALVGAVVFSPDGRWVVSYGADGTVRVWEAASGVEIALMVHASEVRAIAISPDGRWVVSGSEDGEMRVWEAATGLEVSHMLHDNIVVGVAFSPDGRWVVSRSVDGIVQIWETVSGDRVARLEDDNVTKYDFSPDWRWVALAGADGTALVWMWQPEDLIAEVCRRLPRNLTEEEWAQYFPGEEYRLTCPELGIGE